MESAPNCLLKMDVSTEVDGAWKSAFLEIEERHILSHANVIGSYIMYKMKEDETGIKGLKHICTPMAIETSKKAAYNASHISFRSI